MTTTETNKQLARDYFQAFLDRDDAWWHPGIPDMTVPIEDLIAEGEKVLVRLSVKGTHGGEGGAVPTPPRGSYR